jgi:hypothetical protein
MTHTLQQVTLEAKIIRRDGTVEDLGTIASWNRDAEQRKARRTSFPTTT